MSDEITPSKPRSGVCRCENGDRLAGVPAADGASGEVDNPVDFSIREYLRLRPGLLQLLAEHGTRSDEGLAHLRLEEKEERRDRTATGLRGRMMNAQCFKVIFAVAVIGSIGSLAGWYWEELVDVFSQEISSVQFGPALLWCVLASILVRFLNSLIFKD